MSRKLLAIVLSAVGLLGLSGLSLLAAPTAEAAVIPNAITGVSLTSTPSVGRYATSTFDCTWAVPDGSSAGDTFTLQLPQQLSWFGTADFDLKDTAGDVVATAHADASGLVTFILTSFVSTHPHSVNGTCAFTTLFTAEQTQAGPTTLQFMVGSTVYPIDVVEAGPCTSSCETAAPTTASKNGYWADTAQTRIHSFIEDPATTDTVNTVTITDTPAGGTSIDCTSVAPTIGMWDPATGAIAQPDRSADYPAAVDCTPAGVTVTWADVPAGQYTRLDLDTVVTDAALGAYKNTGTVVMNGESTPVQSTVETTAAAGTGTGQAPASRPTPTPTPTATLTPTPTPTSTLTPAPAGATSTPAPSATGPATPSAREHLAETGSDLTAPLSAALALTAAGVGIAIARTYRRRHATR
ncbi:hypothetical protein ASE16_17620 [Leifsonia sp. Root227]|uniref:Ig-like domain-containing protein n=1 Tax=Leifsonia sp. Root227 TaxID=1736496 RepID=UPI0006F8912A|nr:Ig-like domain-containing protein [Leifsonia sp. Root227]KRC47154.1 hypothetical protein ASE16_17620 [Leifsonia sp. Root227]